MSIEGMLKRGPNDTVLARFFKFTGGTSQVHLRHHCDAPGSKIHVNRRLQRRSSQVGRLHMRTRLKCKVFVMKYVFIHVQTKLIFISKALHLASLS